MKRKTSTKTKTGTRKATFVTLKEGERFRFVKGGPVLVKSGRCYVTPWGAVEWKDAPDVPVIRVRKNAKA